MSNHPEVNYGTVLKMLGVVFVGLHVPLAALGLARFAIGLTDPLGLMVATLAGTLVAALATLGLLWKMMVPPAAIRATA